ncbi:MAG: LytTR family DNA-binding domain-containing protein [Pyrinomonadaceae bacterium]
MNNYLDPQIFNPANAWRRMPESRTLLPKLAFGLSVVAVISIVQDLIHSRVNNYTFYFSESILFKAFWLIFVPLLFLQLRYLGKEYSKPRLAKLAAVLVPTLAHLLLTPLVVYVVSAVFYSHTFSYYQMFAYTLSEDIYKSVLIYIVFALFVGSKLTLRKAADESACSLSEVKANVEEVHSDQIAGLESLIISNGRKYTPIAVSAILYVTAATPYVTIHLENKRFLHNESLKSIDKKFNRMGFVRIHRSTIINLSKVVSYKSRLNGDYDVLLEDGTETRLSRNYVSEFKRYFQNRPQVNQ